MSSLRERAEKFTESDSVYRHLAKMSVRNLLANINREDRKVPRAVAVVIPALEKLVSVIVQKINAGGRLFYIGAGTSGRLGIVDASEIPPTFGVSQGVIVAIIAGGDSAIREAIEFAEDATRQGWKDLQAHLVSPQDVVLGIAASGSTPYVVSALAKCRAAGITTACGETRCACRSFHPWRVSSSANSIASRIAESPPAMIATITPCDTPKVGGISDASTIPRRPLVPAPM